MIGELMVSLFFGSYRCRILEHQGFDVGEEEAGIECAAAVDVTDPAGGVDEVDAQGVV